MKRILSLFLLLIITLSAIVLTGCTGEKKELLMLQPSYVGETVTDTDHTFKKEDFKLLAIYTQNETEEITDFTFEVKGMKNGLYTVLIKWNDLEEECYVKIETNVYE